VGVTDVRRVWTEILAAVKRQRRTTQVLLESATVAGLDSGVLMLTMPSPALARRVTEPGNTDVLRAALHEVLGVDWRVRCEAGDPASSQAPAGGATGGSAAGGGVPGRAPTADDERAARPDAQHRQSSRAASSTDAAPRAEDSADGGPEPDDVDPYDEIDPDAPAVEVQDPEQVAIDLLASRLGARRLDPEN
jgi:DNA polymerase-3 subunit gamma/tau